MISVIETTRFGLAVFFLKYITATGSTFTTVPGTAVGTFGLGFSKTTAVHFFFGLLLDNFFATTCLALTERLF